MGIQLKKHKKVTVHGFIIDSSKENLNWIFETYPKTASKVKIQDDKLRTRYMKLHFRIIKILYQTPLGRVTDDDMVKVYEDLADVKQAGFSVEWIASKAEKISLEKKASEDRIQELKQELEEMKITISQEKAKLDKKPSWILMQQMKGLLVYLGFGFLY